MKEILATAPSMNHARLDATAEARSGAMFTQDQATEAREILDLVREWAGGEAEAMAWFRAQPIPALDGLTAEVLVGSGRASAVRHYLDLVDRGSFA